MAWVSWEAYLERVVTLGIAKQGLSIADAQEVLRMYRAAARGRSLDQALRKMFGAPPDSLPGRPGSTWRQLNGRPGRSRDGSATTHSFRERRNGLVHGSRSLRPAVARHGVELIRDAVVENEVYREVGVVIAFGLRAGFTEPLGGVLRVVRPAARPDAVPEEVVEWLLERD